MNTFQLENNPDAEPCGKCHGTGEVEPAYADGDGEPNIERPCLRCLGTGIEDTMKLNLTDKELIALAERCDGWDYDLKAYDSALSKLHEAKAQCIAARREHLSDNPIEGK